jgi:hypothetical protein
MVFCHRRALHVGAQFSSPLACVKVNWEEPGPSGHCSHTVSWKHSFVFCFDSEQLFMSSPLRAKHQSSLIATDALIFGEKVTHLWTRGKKTLTWKYITPMKHTQKHAMWDLYKSARKFFTNLFLPANIYHPKNQESLRQATITSDSAGWQVHWHPPLELVLWMSSFQVTWYKCLSLTVTLFRYRMINGQNFKLLFGKTKLALGSLKRRNGQKFNDLA